MAVVTQTAKNTAVSQKSLRFLLLWLLGQMLTDFNNIW